MFKVEKGTDRATITAYGIVGGYYLDYRNIAAALDEVSRSGYRQVDVRIHTEGGSVIDGNLIYNFISAFKGRVDIYIDGIAASMGSIIATASDHVHIAENGFIMIHSPRAGGYGTAQELVESAKLLRSMERNFTTKLAARMNKTVDEIKASYFDGSDHWIDANEAVALGLAQDKFTARNGNLTFTKSDAERQGLKGLFSQYTSALTNDTPTPEINMKQVLIALHLKEDANEQIAAEAVTALKKRATDAEAALKIYQDKENNSRKAEAKSLLDAAQNEQRIDAATRPAWEKQFENDHETAKALLNGIPKRVNAKDFVAAGTDTDDQKFMKMTWNELDKSGQMAAFKAKHPDEYREKFKAEFGKYPE